MRFLVAVGAVVAVLVLVSPALQEAGAGPLVDVNATGLIVEVESLGGVPSQGCYRVALGPGPNSLRDGTVGTVARQLAAAVGRELQHLYGQLKRVYGSAFIDAATGASLDSVVSLLDVSLKPIVVAQIDVTIGDRAQPGKPVFEATARATNEFETPPVETCEPVRLAASQKKP